MTEERLAELDHLASAASPGPWKSDESVVGWLAGEAPACIAAARAAVPELLAEIRTLRAACTAALAYDASICGAAARGEVSLSANDIGFASGPDLDALYEAWITAARAAMHVPEVS